MTFSEITIPCDPSLKLLFDLFNHIRNDDPRFVINPYILSKSQNDLIEEIYFNETNITVTSSEKTECCKNSSILFVEWIKNFPLAPVRGCFQFKDSPTEETWIPIGLFLEQLNDLLEKYFTEKIILKDFKESSTLECVIRNNDGPYFILTKKDNDFKERIHFFPDENNQNSLPLCVFLLCWTLRFKESNINFASITFDLDHDLSQHALTKRKMDWRSLEKRFTKV